jgi:c-di-AMP phosphodiesterase-like protein
LHYGGLVYFSLFTLFIGGMMFRLKSLYGNIRWLIYILLITIVVTNVKGLTISIIPSFRMIMLIYCYLIMEAKSQKKPEYTHVDSLNLSI